MSDLNKESLRIAELLERLVLFQKASQQQIEADLGYGRGTLGRIFSGKIELKYRHLDDILRAIGLPLEVFFQIAYDMREVDGASNPTVLNLRQVNPSLTPPSLANSKQRFEEAVKEVLQKHLLLPTNPSPKPGGSKSRKKKPPKPE